MVMMAPFNSILSDNMNLVVALFLGFGFGFFLKRGGMDNPHKMSGIFYFRDFNVPKVMFTAILVAATGLVILSDLKVLDMGKVWIIPTFFWPQIVGGFVMGIGFLLAGYCPGTSMAALTSGRIDALVAMLGIAFGSILFAVLYPGLEGFFKVSDMGKPTLPELMGVNHWVVLILVFAVAGGLFYGMGWLEKNGVSYPPSKKVAKVSS
jgi:uncharacterized membrane protein YedE/YeeE